MNGNLERMQRANPGLGLAGPVAAAMFAASVIGFAMLRTDGYSHGTKAVSELGAVGAPHAIAFNMLGFVIPGLLVVIVAIALKQRAGSSMGVMGPILLALSGLAMALAGVFPIEPADESSTSSRLHYAGAILTGVFWALSVFWIGPALKRLAGLRKLGSVTPWFAIFLFSNVLWQVAYQSGLGVLPGWGQRIAFFGYFLWVSWAGFALWTQGTDQAPADRTYGSSH